MPISIGPIEGIIGILIDIVIVTGVGEVHWLDTEVIRIRYEAVLLQLMDVVLIQLRGVWYAPGRLTRSAVTINSPTRLLVPSEFRLGCVRFSLIELRQHTINNITVKVLINRRMAGELITVAIRVFDYIVGDSLNRSIRMRIKQVQQCLELILSMTKLCTLWQFPQRGLLGRGQVGLENLIRPPDGELTVPICHTIETGIIKDASNITGISIRSNLIVLEAIINIAARHAFGYPVTEAALL